VYKNSKNDVYKQSQPHRGVIAHDARPTIIDAYFQDGARSVSLFLLPIQAANTSYMAVCNVSPPRLPGIHDQQFLTLN